MTKVGYARVSRGDRTLDAQLQALVAAGATEVFQETANGSLSGRGELEKALRALAPGDTLLVARLDSVARSTRDLLDIVDRVSRAGAAFRSLGDPWTDTSTPHGRAMLPVLSGLAEFDRELLRARTSEGRKRAKARGQPMGRPSALTDVQREAAFKALASGEATQADLARRFAVSQSTISRLAEKASPLSAKSALDAETERTARAFLRRIESLHAVHEGVLFGSRARGAHHAESDADIAVVLNGPHGNRTAAALDMAGVAFDVFLETGVLVDPLPLWRDEVERPETFPNPALINNILREGVRL